MDNPGTADCARCGKTLQPSNRFCPECGLPATGGSVLSSQIGVLRTAPKAETDGGVEIPWRRILVPTASAVTVAIVLAVGLLLFNRPLIETVFPEVREADAAQIVMRPSWEPVWVQIPPGAFHVGPPFEVSDEEINSWLENGVQSAVSSWRITNERWLEYLLANEEWLKKEQLWRASGDSWVPRFADGWRREGGPDGRPIPPDGTGDRPRVDDLIGERRPEAVRAYLRWYTQTPAYHIETLAITHEKWLRFLGNMYRRRAEPDQAAAFEASIPGPASGWHRNGEGTMPSPPIELIELDAEWMPVSHVSEGALAVFDEWYDTSGTLRWPPSIESPRPIWNWLWRDFLYEMGDRLVAEGLWEQAVPGSESGWTIDSPYAESMPTYAYAVVDSGRISDVSLEAVRRYHDLVSTQELTYGFEISRFEVSNALWRDFIEDRAQELDQKGVLDEANPGNIGGWQRDETGRYAPPPDALDLPVRNVSAYAASLFGRYLTDRLDLPGWFIRVPREVEWEYAARGAGWREFPWGRDFLLPPEPGTGDPKPPIGIYSRRPLPVDSVDPADVSPFKVVGMGTNVSELVERWDRDDEGTEYRWGTELRGASFREPAQVARSKARVWHSRDVDRRTRWPDVGVRLVKIYIPPTE